MIRIGIVGCGRILAAHLRGYQLLREAGVDWFQITALCARREADAQSYVQRGEGPPQRQPVGTAPGDPLSVGDIYLSDFQPGVPVQVYTDYRQMVAQAPVDAVNDFTSHALHHRVAEAAFASGKHLLTQKPLAASVRAARAMCEQAASRGLSLAVFENARNRPDTRHLEWLFRSGKCGQLQLVLLTNIGNWWAPDQIVAHTAWRHRRAEGGGITLDIGVHLFHHLRHVAGEIETVTAHTDILEPVRRTRDAGGSVVEQVDCDADDTVLATFRTERGVTGTMAVSWAGHGGGLTSGAGRGLVYYGSQGNVRDDSVFLDGTLPQSLETLYRQHCPADEQARHFPFGLQDAFALNQLDWLQSIRLGRPAETNGEEGLRDLAASFAVLESSLAGRRVAVDEVLSGELAEYQKPINERCGL